jgi:ATP-binding cassette, subfamily B, bacterial PglK
MSSESSITESTRSDLPVRKQVRFWRDLSQLYQLMSRTRRRQFYSVLSLSLVGAVAELATIGAVLPFLSLLANENDLAQLGWVTELLRQGGANSARDLLVAATFLFASLALMAGYVRLLFVRRTQAFMSELSHDLNVEIQRRILLQTYSFHITQNSSRVLASLESVYTVVQDLLYPIIQAATSALIAIFIVAALILVDPLTTIAVAATFSLIYLLVSLFARRRLVRNSKIIDRVWNERVKLVQESLGDIRDVILNQSQGIYLDAFTRLDRRFKHIQANIAIMAAAPRFLIEAAGIVLIAALALILTYRDGGLAGALPVLGALALGAQRLLPLVQQIYSGWTNASGYRSLLSESLELLSLPVSDEAERPEPVEPLPLRNRIAVEAVSFAYGGRAGLALDSVSLEIPCGSSLALIGRTGSGKSTLADLLMGLIEPSAGRIMVDGVPLTAKSRRRWQMSIAHVPQAIFLADTSIARNIAFAIPSDAINRTRIIEAAVKAQLHDFVEALPEGYETTVGERGIRLSGGQRQRLGLARAIYKDTPVLVLDEATSSLDEATEAAVLQAVDILRREGRTIIIIAHRNSTIARCDLVVRLENGRIVDTGSYAGVRTSPACEAS